MVRKKVHPSLRFLLLLCHQVVPRFLQAIQHILIQAIHFLEPHMQRIGFPCATNILEEKEAVLCAAPKIQIRLSHKSLYGNLTEGFSQPMFAYNIIYIYAFFLRYPYKYIYSYLFQKK